MQIRALSENDLKDVAYIHQSAFPKSALTKLGVETVRRYYLWQLKGPHESYCDGAFIEYHLAGFCFAGVFQGAETGFLTNNWIYLVSRMITRPWLLNNEIIRDRIRYSIQELKNYKKRINSQVQSQSPTVAKFGILSIAVHPNYQCRRVGYRLMENAEMSARQQGFKSMRLTVHTDNYQAIAFYEKLGWRKRLVNGLWEGYMEKTFQDDSITDVTQSTVG